MPPPGTINTAALHVDIGQDNTQQSEGRHPPSCTPEVRRHCSEATGCGHSSCLEKRDLSIHFESNITKQSEESGADQQQHDDQQQSYDAADARQKSRYESATHRLSF